MDPHDSEPITIEIFEPDPQDPKKLRPRKLQLRVDIPCMMRLRTHYDPPIDIRRLIDPESPTGGLWGQMSDDPSIAVDIAYEATRHLPDAPATTTEFASGLGGDALGAITEAVLKAVVSFTPDPKNRKAYQSIIDKADAIFGSIRTKAIAELERGDHDHELEAKIRDILGIDEAGRPISTAESCGSAES